MYVCIESVNIILDCQIAKYIFNVINSNNITITSLINTFLNCESSVFAESFRYIMYKYNSINIVTKRLKHWFRIFHTQIRTMIGKV